MLPLTVSVVVYKSEPEDLMRLLKTLASSDLTSWVVVDNSANEDQALGLRLRDMVLDFGGIYLPAAANVGFGAGHNLALALTKTASADFHLMCNPDILCEAGVFDVLVQEMKVRPDVGLIMPKVLYEDGSFQPVCKLLPDPADFALRRFAPGFVKRVFQSKLALYEMQGIESVECEKVPFLSGCFLFARRSVLDRVNGFDERFFLYLEDVDLCRRMAQHSKLLYWPGASVVHICFRGAYRNAKLLRLFLRSAVAYFQKWGWFFDSQRKHANREALLNLRSKLPKQRRPTSSRPA